MPRKTLDASVTDFSDSIGLLLRRLRAASASQELSWTESAVIARLANDGPATTADLARAEGIKPQSMGTTIAALEEMGIVERKPHPTDGRQVYIALTAKGAAVRKSAKDARRAWLMQAVLQLDERERETLFRAGEIIQRMAEGRIAQGRIAQGRVAETRLVEKRPAIRDEEDATKLDLKGENKCL